MSAPATPARPRPLRNRPSLALSFGALVVIGLNGGASGVLIPDQQADYHADKSTIGLLFFAFSAGYLISGAVNGLLIRRLGARGQLALGGLVMTLGAVGSALAPPFPVLVGLAVVLAFGAGALDAGYNAFVAHLPEPTTLLNLLHACYGLGALIGPLIAAFLLNAGYGWQSFYVVLAPFGLALAVGALALLPGPAPVDRHEDGTPTASLTRALARSEVWLGMLFLTVYVGVEVTVGNWGFSYLTQLRGVDDLLAGWVVSGYWLGITLGRFVVNAITSRLGMSTAAMMYAMVLGVCGCSVLLWAAPDGPLVAAALLLMGVFLGPVFPTTIAVIPQLTPSALVPTAVGLLVGFSVIGGSILPWLAGTLAQHLGLGSLPPYLLVLGAVCVLSWWSIARRMGQARAAGSPVADAGRAAAQLDAPIVE
jgi:fucose permease